MAESQLSLGNGPELFDPWTREYALLGLRLDRIAPGTVDAWIGPPAWREGVGAEPLPTSASLRDDAETLLDRLPSMNYEVRREAYLTRQVRALHTITRLLDGEEMPFAEQVELFFDIKPERIPESTFESAHRQLADALPGTGSLGEKLLAFRDQFIVPRERVPGVLQRVSDEVRARTRRHFDLPAHESVQIELVREKPWGAYNWYLGNAQSLIEVNTDLPTRALGMPDYMAHEGYPGHHTEHALREYRQLRSSSQGEYAIQLINTPESLISEAIATSAAGLIFEGREDLQWLVENVLPDLDVQMDVAQAQAIREASEGLSGVNGNAAFLLHEDALPVDEVAAYIEHWGLRAPREARKSIEFLSSPLWRAYTFTYQYGHALLRPLLSGVDRFGVFERIVTEPVYPSLLTAWQRS